MRAFSRALTVNPKHVEAFVALVDLHSQSGNHAEATKL
jgi:hypothetical protein